MINSMIYLFEKEKDLFSNSISAKFDPKIYCNEPGKSYPYSFTSLKFMK